MKKQRRFISILILAIYLFSIMPIQAFAGNDNITNEYENQAFSDTFEETSEEITEEISVSTSDKESEEISEQLSVEVSEEISEELLEEISEESSKEISEGRSEEISEQPSEEISEEPSEVNSEETSIIIDGEVSEYMAFDEEAVLAGTGTEEVNIGINGKYKTETTETILSRINAIRKEAVTEGLIDPATGKKFTAGQNTLIKWSYEMEAIARIRAAEISVCGDKQHYRPNGKYYTSLSCNSVTSAMESLAWNNAGIMQSIEQWYAEKEAYKTNGSGNSTKNYEALISSKYTCVGLGCFQKAQASKYAYAAAMEMAATANPNQIKDTSANTVVQSIAVKPSYIDAINITEFGKAYKENGSVTKVGLNGTAKFTNTSFADPQTVTTKILGDLNWSSTNTSVASIDAKGTLTAKGVGTAAISVSKCGFSKSENVYVYPQGGSPYKLTPPTKTVYMIGDRISLDGGSLTNIFFDTKTTLTSSMISGFSTKSAGVCKVTVTYDGFKLTYEVLVLDTIKVEVMHGATLSTVTIPGSDYGSFAWKNPAQKMDVEVGVYMCDAVFTPKDTSKFNKIEMKIEVTVYRMFDDKFTVKLAALEYIYDGGPQEPEASVVYNNKDLVPNKDFTVSYNTNKNAGNAKAVLTGIGFYKGNLEKEFVISKAEITITAENLRIAKGTALPDVYKYRVVGLCGEDNLVKQPTVTCEAISPNTAGTFLITPKDANAGANYNITYVNGNLIIGTENIGYRVDFVLGEHGMAVAPIEDVIAGSLVTAPITPEEEGFTFIDWYKDDRFTQRWDFNKDIVQEDITLYAKWVKNSTLSAFRITDIADQTYTGSKLKPLVTVYDGDILLKAGRDYSISYVNNQNTNIGGKLKVGDGTGNNFNSLLPYVIIKGKGNYADQVEMNFNILPKSIGNDAKNECADIKLSYSDQCIQSKSNLVNVLSSVKYKSTLKVNRDYDFSLLTQNVKDMNDTPITSGLVMDNGKVPKGYYGNFLLIISGKGNYIGTIEKAVTVKKKENLMKYVSVSVGAKQKNFTFSGEEIKLTPGYYNSKTKKYYTAFGGAVTTNEVKGSDIFTVRYGSNYLINGKDYNVFYTRNVAVGTATMTLVGKNNYSGTKSVTFKIKGIALSASKASISGITDMPFTGRAITQNGARIIYKESNTKLKSLTYGKEYLITYKNNINAGTATMTFMGNTAEGYTGKFSKTFKITKMDLANEESVSKDVSMSHIRMQYDSTGAKPVDEIVLTNLYGRKLVNGKDFTLSYKNNKAIAAINDVKAPVVTVKGKGNYTGAFSLTFSIEPRQLTEADMKITVKQLAFTAKAKEEYVYKPSIKISVNKATLKNGKDYTIQFEKNTQKEISAYIEKVLSGTASDTEAPRITISAVGESNYVFATKTLIMPVYAERLSTKNTCVVVSKTSYSGSCMQPDVSVYYSNDPAKIKFAKGTTNETELLKLGLVKLNKDTDYKVSYGSNIKSGKTAGNVTITGKEAKYGGSFTVKFSIDKKEIIW